MFYNNVNMNDNLVKMRLHYLLLHFDFLPQKGENNCIDTILQYTMYSVYASKMAKGKANLEYCPLGLPFFSHTGDLKFCMQQRSIKNAITFSSNDN